MSWVPGEKSILCGDDDTSGSSRAQCLEQKDVDWMEDGIRTFTLTVQTSIDLYANTFASTKSCM